MRHCRIGMVGAGGVAQRHARMLGGIPEAELVAVTDVYPARAELLAQETGMSAVLGVRQLLDAGVDAVYICVPPFAHGAVEEQVLGAGKAMFVEKPLGSELAVAESIGEAVAAAGVVTAVGHHWRYSRAVARAAELLNGRPVRLVIGSWLDKVPPVAWWARRDGSGGQIVEQAVHVIDLARTLVGEIDDVVAVADPAPPRADGADIDSSTAALLRFRGGAVGTLAATCQLSWKHRASLEIVADDLVLTITEEAIEVREGATTVSERVDPDAAKLAADQAFVDAVLGRPDASSPVLVDYQEALETHRVACQVAAAAAPAGVSAGAPG